MKTSYSGRAFLAREEGCVLSAYRDTVGVWTIGIGHTSNAGPPTVSAGLRLSLQACFDLFEKDLRKYEDRVRRAFKAPLTQAQFDAAVSFDYNTGSINKASWVDVFNTTGNAAAAAKGMLAWKKPPEIIGRRKRERALFEYGEYGNISGISVSEKLGGKTARMPFPKVADEHEQPPPPDIEPIETPPVAYPKPDAGLAGGAGAGGALIASQGGAWLWVGLAVVAVAAVGFIGWRYRVQITQFIDNLKGNRP